MNDERWPALSYDGWKDTYATVQLWSQIVGKIALALAPPLNHSWGVALQVLPRGPATRTLPHGNRALTIAFDFVDHLLCISTSDGEHRTLPLRPQSVAAFYAELMGTLDAMALPVKIWPVAVELPEPIRLDSDTVHHSYDADAINRFWRIVLQTEQVLTASRCPFVGKCSPAHFFWGGFDLALTRFSGRPAPPREGPAFMREAYSHEVISHGFWAGGGPLLEAAFYGYAVPEPAGFKEAAIEPAQAYYHRELGEFILPYEAVRTAPSPERALQQFIETTYDRAATLAQWDRKALERASAV